jgi:hypothetical protein
VLKGCQTPQQLLQELQQQKLEQQGGVLNAIHVSTSYDRLGVMCRADGAAADTEAAQQLLQHLGQLLLSVRGQMDTRALANIIWSCGHTQHVGPLAQLLEDLLQPRILSSANSQDVGNVMWALVTLEQQVPPQQLQQLADALAIALVSQPEKVDPQHISNSLWALGKLGYQVLQQQLSVLLAAFTAEGKLSRASTQAIASLLVGVAYMGQQVPDAQLQLLMASLVSKCSRANTQDLANSVWALSEMVQQVQAQQLAQLRQLLAAFVQQLHRALPQEIANILLACARFRLAPVELLAALEQPQQMQRFLAAANPQNLANTAWACGMLGQNSELLLAGLLQQAVKLLQQDCSRFVCQDMCTMCWAVAVLDLRHYVPQVLQLAEAASRVWGSASSKGMQQLHQTHLWLLDHKLAPAKGGKGPGLLQVLSQQQLDECRQACQDQVATSAAAVPSLLQQQVFEALHQLSGWQDPPQQEQPTDDHNFSIDIVAVTAAGVRLAVEVDGRYHFVWVGDKWEVEGPTQYRDRALKARGYTVVSIPWWEWEQLKGAQQQRQYLQNKIQGATVVGHAADDCMCSACALCCVPVS